MIKKIKSFSVIIASLLMMLLPAALPTAVSHAASCAGVPETVAGGAATASGGQVGCNANGGLNNSTGTAVGTIASEIVNVFSIIVGAAAIIMIIYSGFRYITSGGSTERIGNAKTTLIYAIIGLVVVALAQLLVHFVLSASVNQGGAITT